MDNLEKVNILLVDDNPGNLLALEAALADLGQKLIKAESGMQALRFLLKHDFAAILLDVQMPNMDGFETAKLIRERERSRHTPIIFITAIGTTLPDVSRGYSVGAVDYIVKPYDVQILKSKVAVFIDLFRMREAVRRQADELAAANQHLAEEIAERKRAEQALQETNAELEQRVQERTARLEDANKELEAFAYSVSHDLRAPLSLMNRLSRLLAEDFRPQMSPEAERYAELIHQSSQQMEALIDDILALSRNSRQALKMENVNQVDLVRQVLADLRAAQGDRRIEIRVGALPDCQGDLTLLKQVWTNLISNAIKFTRAREIAHVEIGGTTSPDETEVVYFVKDDGAGFDMSYVDQLFGAFHRLHSEDEFEGNGIGLAIVKRIIVRHGGQIWAEGQVDRGATFYFTLTNDPTTMTQRLLTPGAGEL